MNSPTQREFFRYCLYSFQPFSLSILNKLIYKTEKETEISENNLLFIAYRSVLLCG